MLLVLRERKFMYLNLHVTFLLVSLMVIGVSDSWVKNHHKMKKKTHKFVNFSFLTFFFSNFLHLF